MNRWILILGMAVMGCSKETEEGPPADTDIFAVGDSVFDWHSEDGLSAPDRIGVELGLKVFNASVSGAEMSVDSGRSISDQYVSGDWDWVVMDGGGNDLNDRCGCGECDAVQDQVESAFADFVAERRSEGLSVVIWGYYGIPDGAEFGFARCTEAVTELSRRQQALAATDEGVLWVDGRQAIDGQNSAHFDEDNVHPSVQGSRIIGAQIAEAIQASGR
jgi:hypothetical protein